MKGENYILSDPDPYFDHIMLFFIFHFHFVPCGQKDKMEQIFREDTLKKPKWLVE